MKTKKQVIKLQKSSGLFMQLGLVLTLAIVYMFFEHKTETTKHHPKNIAVNVDDDIMYVNYKDIVIEREVEVVKQKPLPKSPTITDYKKSKESNKAEKEKPAIFNSPDNAPLVINKEPVFKYVEPEDEPIEYIATVPEVPIYPGCEKEQELKRKHALKRKLEGLSVENSILIWEFN